MDKEIGDYTKKELLGLENFNPVGTFKEIVIVPAKKIHNSGFRCMKFILLRYGKIVGVVSGWSDVMHLDFLGEIEKPMWRIDCLPKSRCLRIFTGKELKLCGDSILSDFYFTESK